MATRSEKVHRLDGNLTKWEAIPNADNDLRWWRNKGIVKLNFIISIIYFGQALNGYDGTILGSLQALSQWKVDLGHPDASRIGLLNSMSYIAGFLITPFATWLLDAWGRKWAMRYYAFTMLVGTVLGCIAGTVGQEGGYALFCVSKFIIGGGLATGLITMQMFTHEVAHPRYRSLTASFFNPWWTMGHVIGAWVCFATSHLTSSWQWRIPYIIQLAPAVYILVAVQFIPETPRWLMDHGRDDEALAFLVLYHGNGNPEDELVLFEFEEIKETLAAERAAKETTWKSVLRSPANRHRLFLAGMMTFVSQMDGSAIISFYYTSILTLVGITGSTKQTGIGAGLSMWGFFAGCFGVWLMTKTGRRTIVLTMWPIILSANIFLTVASAVYANSGNNNSHAGLAAVVAVWLYSGADAVAGAVYYSYPAEVLTYLLRAKGMGLWNLVNQGFGLYGAYANSVALAAISWKYYIVYAVLIVFQWFLMYFFVVETKGATLEEIAIAFEGKSAAVAQIDARLEVGIIQHEVADKAEQEKGSGSF